MVSEFEYLYVPFILLAMGFKMYFAHLTFGLLFSPWGDMKHLYVKDGNHFSVMQVFFINCFNLINFYIL